MNLACNAHLQIIQVVSLTIVIMQQLIHGPTGNVAYLWNSVSRPGQETNSYSAGNLKIGSILEGYSQLKAI